jgi:hypothetical protein
VNVRRGLFRLWLVFAVLFVMGVVGLYFGDLREEFRRASLMKNIAATSILLLPTDCTDARGAVDIDYTTRTTDPHCWYELPKFRTHYPEYNDLSEDDLAEKLYGKAGIPTNRVRPWRHTFQVLAAAFGIPLAFLFLGTALVWATEGFRSSS